MHGMDWVHWIGVLLAAPATVLVLRASWQAHLARRSHGRPVTLSPPKETE